MLNVNAYQFGINCSLGLENYRPKYMLTVILLHILRALNLEWKLD